MAHPTQGETARRALTMPDLAWGPLAVGGMLGAVGLIGLAAGQPWLFPSLGPTAFLQAEEPGKPASRFYNTMVGHLVGLLAGIVAVKLCGADSAPAVLAAGTLAPLRVAAAVVAAALTMLALALLRASHPPAAATTLLVALGAIKPTWGNAGDVLAGVAIVAVLGEGLRYLRREVLVPPTQAGD